MYTDTFSLNIKPTREQYEKARQSYRVHQLYKNLKTSHYQHTRKEVNNMWKSLIKEEPSMRDESIHQLYYYEHNFGINVDFIYESGYLKLKIDSDRFNFHCPLHLDTKANFALLKDMASRGDDISPIRDILDVIKGRSGRNGMVTT